MIDISHKDSYIVCINHTDYNSGKKQKHDQ